MDALKIYFKLQNYDTSEEAVCSENENNFLPGETRRIFCRDGAIGSYIYLINPGKHKQLLLCEVEVYARVSKRMYFCICWKTIIMFLVITGVTI